ncbi:serine hydrolase domain-containing protein [Oryzobacter sp. R7]|uniref:serine hydrolase domain-containing protein n=1 Tax=Oryzobacter faecalis TaxID=3388656 RepID=UPI00398CD52A
MSEHPEGAARHGDEGLAARAARRLGRHHPRFVVALVDPGGVRTAAVGVPLAAEVEIGSVSKGVTGLLFADARDRGEVTDATRLGDVLPLGGSDVAGVTLGSLAVHRSGLPRLAAGTASLRLTWDLLRHGTNPYGETLDEVLEAARSTPVGPPRPTYSNLGFMLLGHAVAAAAGTTYAALVRDRIAAPLGLTATSVPARPTELGPCAVLGRSRGGRDREAWTGEGLGPAGGIRSTVGDLGRLVASLLDGTAPGLAALDPVADLRGSRLRIGAAWMTMTRRDVTLTWHNGGTGGFRSVVALDRAAGAGVALVSATPRSVEGVGMALLQHAVEEGARRAG